MDFLMNASRVANDVGKAGRAGPIPQDKTRFDFPGRRGFRPWQKV
jgi:hypothetical protein